MWSRSDQGAVLRKERVGKRERKDRSGGSGGGGGRRRKRKEKEAKRSERAQKWGRERAKTEGSEPSPARKECQSPRSEGSEGPAIGSPSEGQPPTGSGLLSHTSCSTGSPCSSQCPPVLAAWTSASQCGRGGAVRWYLLCGAGVLRRTGTCAPVVVAIFGVMRGRVRAQVLWCVYSRAAPGARGRAMQVRAEEVGRGGACQPF